MECDISLITIDGTSRGVVHAPPSHELVCSVRPCVSIKLDPFLHRFYLCGGSRYNPAQRSVHYTPACSIGRTASNLKGGLPADRFDFLNFVLLLLCSSLAEASRAPYYPAQCLLLSSSSFFLFFLFLRNKSIPSRTFAAFSDTQQRW
jgi:hypothetical protein